jgi:hypothetical protein
LAVLLSFLPMMIFVYKRRCALVSGGYFASNILFFF